MESAITTFASACTAPPLDVVPRTRKPKSGVDYSTFEFRTASTV